MKIILKTPEEMLSQKRFEHCKRVLDVALSIGKKHALDIDKIQVAALYHDYCKEMPREKLIKYATENSLFTSSSDIYMPQILHGPVAANLLEQEEVINDPEILEAIRYHTVGHPEMGQLSKVIFIADYVEPARKTPNIDLFFDLALHDLDSAMLKITNQMIDYLLQNDRLIHINTIILRNNLLAKGYRL